MDKSGLILLNKKQGVTSFEALGEIKRVLGTGKVGHTGTLDKFATGLLVVLAGRALKLSAWFSHCDKQYVGRICFGAETDTLDPEGEKTAEAPLPSREEVESAIAEFTGSIMQMPPVYSAIHVNGKRASALARSGETPQMKERPVSIYRLELRSWQPPFAEIFVHCSSGTYIRSLVRDIALLAGSRAYLYALTRTQVAGFKLEDAQYTANDGKISLKPIDRTVIRSLGLPWFEISPSEAEKIVHGKPLEPILDGKQLSSAPSAPDFRAAVFLEESLIAIVEKTAGKWKYGCVL
ncbi:MAG: tRNA pseudouridine(55) synthase TruB [Spirochaetes bacterium]|nr:tRNA pseudouridine(55) synthase TruB [Spirochaetota bacterium]